MADAHGSGPCAGNSVRVQVPFSALIERPEMKISGLFLLPGEDIFDASGKWCYDVFNNKSSPERRQNERLEI